MHSDYNYNSAPPSRMKAKKWAKLRTRSIIAFVIIFCFCFGIGWGAAGAFDLYRVISDLGESHGDDAGLLADSPTDLPQRVNVLIIGTDARPNENRARSDALMVASIDRGTGRIVVLSVPRDTRISIPGHGINKINAAYALGGASLAVKTVESAVGVKIPYYVATNFNGFKSIIDTLGGVTINVDRRMYKPEEEIDLQPGLQRLNGKDALGFVRFRTLPLGDIDRVENQKKFLLALAEESFKLKTLTKLPQLIPQVRNCVETNFTPGEMLDLAIAAVKTEPQNMLVTTLPGDFLELPGGSYWQINEKLAAGLMDRLMEPGAVAPDWHPTSIVMRPPTTDKPSNSADADEDKTDAAKSSDAASSADATGPANPPKSTNSTKTVNPVDSTNSGSKSNIGTSTKTGDTAGKTADSTNSGTNDTSKTGSAGTGITVDPTNRSGDNTGAGKTADTTNSGTSGTNDISKTGSAGTGKTADSTNKSGDNTGTDKTADSTNSDTSGTSNTSKTGSADIGGADKTESAARSS